ncbi:hypothetical protein BDR05DRAFT_961495, partial [Suillus weaverae]
MTRTYVCEPSTEVFIKLVIKFPTSNIDSRSTVTIQDASRSFSAFLTYPPAVNKAAPASPSPKIHSADEGISAGIHNPIFNTERFGQHILKILWVA